jgi:hypothetical protein
MYTNDMTTIPEDYERHVPNIEDLISGITIMSKVTTKCPFLSSHG